MPVEEGYRPRVMPQAGAPQPLASPDTFGAGIGEQLERAGGQLHASAVRAHQVERRADADRQAADFQHRFALHRQNMDGIVREIRANPTSPDYAEHLERVRQADEAARETLLEGVSEGAVRRQAERQLDEWAVRLTDSEGAFAEGQRIAKVAIDVDRANGLSANRIRQGLDPEAYATELKLRHEAIYSLAGLTPPQKDKLWLAYEQQAGVAFVSHLTDTNPRAARALLDAGQFNQLDPKVLEQLRSGADVEIRREEAAAEHAANMAKAEIRENVQTLEEADRQGIALPGEQYDAAAKALRAVGDESGALKIDGLRDNAAFAKIYEGQSPLQREQRLGALKAKRNPSVAEQREIKWLEDHRAALDQRFNADPVAFAMENAPASAKPPAGDISEPGAMAARVAWAKRAAIAYGRPIPPLTQAEAQQLAANRAGDEAGVLEVLDTIADGRLRIAAAKQVAPEDFAFQHMTLIGPRQRATIRAGADKLKADAKFLTPSAEATDVADTIAGAERSLRAALKEMSVPDQEATLRLARQFMAGYLSHGGHSADEITADQLRLAYRVALGGGITGEGRHVGGLGSWGGRAFVLPPGHDNASFGKAVNGWMAKRPNGGPVNPDGSAIALRQLAPVFVGGNRYRFEAPGGRVAVDKTGAPIVVEIVR